jgi:membrane protein
MSIRDVKDKVHRGWHFTVNDIWDIEITSLSRMRAVGVKTLRVLHLVFRGFKEDECPLHASALTYSTLMAIVPILAFSLALARGFGGAETAKNRIREAVTDWTSTFSHKVTHASTTNATGATTNALPPIAMNATNAAPAIATNGVFSAATNATGGGVGGVDAPVREEQLQSWLAEQINEGVEVAFEKVDNISFTALGGVGLVLLLWMIIQVLGHVERAFNSVWGVTTGRSLWRRFTDYLSVIVVLPILALAASSLPVVDFATRFLDENTADIVRTILGSGMLKGLTVLILSTFCFAFMIVFIPNTRVKFLPGLLGGCIAALLFITWLKLCAFVQVGAARAGRIYGSFAVIPIVLAWVYVSWEIVLFGAEVAFAVQNCTTYRMEQGSRYANVRAQLLLALAIVTEAARKMLTREEVEPGFDAAAYARSRKVPVRFLNEIVAVLVRAGFLAELSDSNGRYALLRAPAAVGVKDVLDAVMASGVRPDALGLGGIDPRLEQAIDQAAGGMGDALQRKSIQDLLSPQCDAKGDSDPPEEA